MPIFLFIYSLLTPLFLILLKIFSFIHPKIRKGFQLRKKQEVYPWLNWQENQEPIWIHCASGEFEYAKPILREIKSKHPKQKIMVTFFSPSVLSSLQKNKDVDFFCPLPWDKKKLFYEFIDFHQPKALLIARTDLWPMMIHACSKRKIPSLLFSKTFNTDKSSLSRWIETRLIKKLSAVFCVSDEDRDLLKKQVRNFPEIHSAGDVRYDQVLHRLSHPNQLKPLNNFNRPIFVAGSTWTSDEDAIIPGIKKLHREISFIIAPHEPSDKHLTRLAKKLKSEDLTYSWYSQTTSWNPMDVLIIDQVGILADLYGWARYSFVGGSMDRSVHSVMEPLGLGCLTFVGPNHTNNREAMTFKNLNMQSIPPVIEISSSDEFTDQFSKHWDKWNTSHQQSLKTAVKKKSGASSIVLNWLDHRAFSAN